MPTGHKKQPKVITARMGGEEDQAMKRRCWYCKKRGRKVRLCKACRHFVCGFEGCPGSPCPKKRRIKP